MDVELGAYLGDMRGIDLLRRRQGRAVGGLAERGDKPFEPRGRGDGEYPCRLRADLKGVG